VLPGVDERLPDAPVLERGHDGSGGDEVRPRADDMEDVPEFHDREGA
jgi:hypothetical protein